jgi:hypothetical protein
LGVDIDTLHNRDKGRNKPDAAALNLMMADAHTNRPDSWHKSPELIEQAAFEMEA